MTHQYPNPKRSSAQSEQGRDKARRGKSEASGIRSAGPAGTVVKVAEASQGMFNESGRSPGDNPSRVATGGLGAPESGSGAVRVLLHAGPRVH